MQNALAHRSANLFKSGLLIAVFAGLVIAVGYALATYVGNPSILTIAIGFSLLTTFVSYFWSDRIALAASGAKPVTEQEQPALYAAVRRLAHQAHIPMPRLYLIDQPQINAFATGRNPSHAAVAVTTGAMRQLTAAELEGVLAHELSHVSNRDILVSSIAVVLAGSVAMASHFLGSALMFGGGNRDERNPVSGIASIALIILAPIAATLMQLAVSRRRESLADATGALLTRRPQDLADALEKIRGDQSRLPVASDATAHLWISNPFKGRERLGMIHKLFMTHPPLEERIAVLRQMRVDEEVR